MMEGIPDETYGITVFQEQVMLLSRLLANFTRGDSDLLRKAMGKKITALMDKAKSEIHEAAKPISNSSMNATMWVKGPMM
jgi:DNA polymerase III subunit alpha